MNFLRILPWFISICVACALQVFPVGHIPGYVQAQTGKAVNHHITADGVDFQGEACTNAGLLHNFSDAAYARRRTNDRNAILYFTFAPEAGGSGLQAFPVTTNANSSSFSSICLSSCYDFLFRLSPF